VDKLWKQLGSATSEILLSLFSRSVLAWTTRSGRLRGRRKSGRSQRSSGASGWVQRLRGVLSMTGEALTKYIADGRKSVVGLVSRNMVDVRGARQVGWLVGDMAG
jgi:hypothetical protein